CGVVVELRIPPSAAVGEPLAVLHHEVDVVQGPRHNGIAGLSLVGPLGPMDLRHPGAVGDGLAVRWNARLKGLDHRRIAEDRGELVAVVTDGDYLPIFVSPEVSEGET